MYTKHFSKHFMYIIYLAQQSFAAGNILSLQMGSLSYRMITQPVEGPTLSGGSMVRTKQSGPRIHVFALCCLSKGRSDYHYFIVKNIYGVLPTRYCTEHSQR